MISQYQWKQASSEKERRDVPIDLSGDSDAHTNCGACPKEYSRQFHAIVHRCLGIPREVMEFKTSRGMRGRMECVTPREMISSRHLRCLSLKNKFLTHLEILQTVRRCVGKK
jgi:hypothetical protein